MLIKKFETIVLSVIILTSVCAVLVIITVFQKRTASLSDFHVSTENTPVDNCELSIMVFGTVNIYISDPISRHLGIPMESNEIANEIPGADYQIDPLWGEDAARGDTTSQTERLSVAHIPDPEEGIYFILIHGQSNLPSRGLGVIARCSNERETSRIITLEAKQKIPITYQFTFSPQNKLIISELERGK